MKKDKIFNISLIFSGFILGFFAGMFFYNRGILKYEPHIRYLTSKPFPEMETKYRSTVIIRSSYYPQEKTMYTYHLDSNDHEEMKVEIKKKLKKRNWKERNFPIDNWLFGGLQKRFQDENKMTFLNDAQKKAMGCVFEGRTFYCIVSNYDKEYHEKINFARNALKETGKSSEKSEEE